MSGVDEMAGAVDVDRLLAGASSAIAGVPFCWLVSATEDGFANVRPMGRLMDGAGVRRDEWTMRFITDGRSRKAAELRRDPRVTIVLENDRSLAFVTLFGTARLYESEPDVRARWTSAYAGLFPTETDRANVMFVEVDVDRMELWIRGVTPEPFGIHTTTLERDGEGGWRVTS